MLSTQFCSTCGAANEATQTQCFACGHALSTSTDALATAGGPLLHERYQLGAVLGSGGFSTVYRAHDVQAGREVAIKQINLQGLSAEEAIEATDTFNREASVLSSLRHPQVPRFYDQFSDQDHWYLVLQYLEGPTLETYLETRISQGKPLQFDEVLEMALQLAEVLDYLHTRQPPIIFRDLKPSNIMRTPPRGLLCLVDFGIARRFRAGQQRDTQALGSPGYAAPEQYGRAQTTPRSDIYSLGALLHFLLSGDDPAEEMSPGLKPLHLHAEKGAQAISELVQRMLSPDPELRPATMSEVVVALEDIQRQRATQPAAHVWQPPVPQDPPPSWEGWRQVQEQVPASPPPPAVQTPAPGRRKVLIGLGGVLAVVGVGSAIWWMLPRPVQSRKHFEKISGTAYAYRGHTDAVYAVAWSPSGQYIASGSKDQTVQIWEATTGKTFGTYREGHPASELSVTWSPDGKYIAAGSEDGAVVVWNVTTSETWSYIGLLFAYSVSWSPKGRYIASSASSFDDNGMTVDDNKAVVTIWDTTINKVTLTHQAGPDEMFVTSVAWSPNGQYIASGSGSQSYPEVLSDNIVQVWNATTGKTILTYRGHMDTVTSVTWSPDGKRIASASADGTVQIWEATTGKTILTLQEGSVGVAVQTVAWSPNGLYIVSGSHDGTVQVWDTTTGKIVLTYQGHTGIVNSVAWSPDSKRIASASDDKTVQVWDAP